MGAYSLRIEQEETERTEELHLPGNGVRFAAGEFVRVLISVFSITSCCI